MRLKGEGWFRICSRQVDRPGVGGGGVSNPIKAKKGYMAREGVGAFQGKAFIRRGKMAARRRKRCCGR